MKTMTSRERVRAAINHQQPDRVPVDFGSTFITGIHCSVRRRAARPLRAGEAPGQGLRTLPDARPGRGRPARRDGRGCGEHFPALHDLRLSQRELEDRGAARGARRCWFPNTSRPSKTTNGIFIYPKGDTTAPPSGHMPKTGYFFDSIIRQEPIDEDNLDPADNLEEFKLDERGGPGLLARGSRPPARHRPRRDHPSQRHLPRRHRAGAGAFPDPSQGHP